MKKTLYYATVSKRNNVIKDAILGFFLSLSSGPRLLLEVFVRTNMGERYFSLSTAIILLVMLASLPVFSLYGFHLFSSYGRSYIDFNLIKFIGQNFSWYLYLAAFLYMCLRRNKEVERLPSVFDLARYSLSTGNIHRRFKNFPIAGKPAGPRTAAILLEPAFFFLIGLVLWIMDQNVGVLLIVCSIIYSLSYQADYHNGDNNVMDIIDARIGSEELVSAFVDGLDPEETRGFQFYGRRPANIETRRRVAAMLMQNDDTVEAF